MDKTADLSIPAKTSCDFLEEPTLDSLSRNVGYVLKRNIEVIIGFIRNNS